MMAFAIPVIGFLCVWNPAPRRARGAKAALAFLRPRVKEDEQANDFFTRRANLFACRKSADLFVRFETAVHLGVHLGFIYMNEKTEGAGTTRAFHILDNQNSIRRWLFPPASTRGYSRR
jgi:hypothetical protein